MSFQSGCSSHRSGEYHIYLLSSPRAGMEAHKRQAKSSNNKYAQALTTLEILLLRYHGTVKPLNQSQRRYSLGAICRTFMVSKLDGMYISCKYAISHLICDSCAFLLPALSSPKTSHRGIVIVATMNTMVLLLGTIAVASAEIYQTLVPTGLPATSNFTDHWGCATENLTQYFQPPEPTRALNFALWSYGTEPPRDSYTWTELFCPYPSHSRCCGFSTYVPESLMSTCSAHSSEAASWWNEHSSAAVSLAVECPYYWGRAMNKVCGGDYALNNALAMASCSESTQQMLTGTTTSSTMATTTAVSRASITATTPLSTPALTSTSTLRPTSTPASTPVTTSSFARRNEMRAIVMVVVAAAAALSLK